MLPQLGLIVPPAAGDVPPEGPALYAGRAAFRARGLGLAEISNRGYDAVIDRVATLAAELAADGAQALSLMGTSLSFYRGGQANEELKRVMTLASGLPATTMSDAVVRGLRAVGARRVAVATAYIDEVNRQLDAFLRESGFTPTALQPVVLPMPLALGTFIVPLIVACAMFMENVDGTVIVTSLPVLARDLGQDPITLKLAVTAYVIGLGVFIPICCWVADRFGSRTVFRTAIGVFMAGSLMCAASTSLGTFVVARFVQGIGGAMMVPVGRIIIFRSVP